MKGLRIFIMVVLGFSLLACERKPTKVYQYVEPEEDIAEQVWNCLKTQHQEVAPVYKQAVDIDYISDDEATTHISKTYLKYNYFIDRGSEEEDNLLVALYQVKCYQTFDDSWLCIVLKEARGYGLDEKDHGKKVFAVDYKNGTLTDRDINTLFPESFKIATDYFNASYYESCLVFDNDGLSFCSTAYWPIRYNWNGKTFDQDPESVVLRNSIHNFYGYFDAPGIGYLAIGKEPIGLNNNDDFVYDGEVMAHFLLKDGKTTGYTLKSPKCGFVQTTDYQAGVDRITSKPIAIGFPIQNVLDYEKKPLSIKDTTIVTNQKDGNYVITQQLMHNTLDRLDIFIEFTSKDKNSNIESIRVYSEEIVVTLEDELRNNDDINPTTKSIFQAANFDVNDPDFGEFNYVGGSDNGFTIHFKGAVDEVRFQTYPAVDGKTLVVLSKHYEKEDLTIPEFWYFQNGNLTKTTVSLPKPRPEDFRAWRINFDSTIPTDGYQLRFTNAGIEYYTRSERNDETDMRDEFGIFINPDFYTVKYNWNGTSFGPDPAE